MRNIQFLSDLHFELNGYPENLKLRSQNDVLLLLGDITCSRFFDPDCDDVVSAEKQKKHIIRFVTEFTSKFSKVLYIPGNHEPYGHDLTISTMILQEWFSKYTNIEVCDTETYNDEGYSIILATLWSDLTDPIGAYAVQHGLNDYNVITHHGNTNLIDVRITNDIFFNQLKYIKDSYQIIRENAPDNKIIVATHHPPSYKFISPIYGGDAINAGFASNLDAMISEMEIDYWLCGHTHHRTQFMIGDCFLDSTGSYGYVPYENDGRLPFYPGQVKF